MIETFAPDSLERVYSSTGFPSIFPNGFEVTENLAAEAARGRNAQRVRICLFIIKRGFRIRDFLINLWYTGTFNKL